MRIRLSTTNAAAYLKDFILPVLTVACSIGGSLCVARMSNENAVDLKRYEVTFNQKHEGYTSFMQHLEETYLAAEKRDYDRINEGHIKLRADLYSLEPFLDQDGRRLANGNLGHFETLCWDIYQSGEYSREKASMHIARFHSTRGMLKQNLFEGLFGSSAGKP